MTTKLQFGIDVVVPRIIELGMAKLPNEACGIIVPNLDKPADEWVIEMVNRSADPLNSFKIDPATIMGLLGSRESWADVLVWHTHPSGAVGPSDGDWAVRLPDERNLVVALPGGEACLY